MAKVKVLIDSLEHDGKRCKPGELIDIEDPAQLVQLGAVEPAKEQKEPKEPKEPKPETKPPVK